MMPDIHISDFDYPLPEERIAKYPLAERDASKLLCCKRLRPGEFEIKDCVFRQLPEMIPANALMVFNDTKVVPARLHFVRESGAHIEVFCLEPVTPAEYATNFATTASCRWKCIIGNAKRWKNDVLKLYMPSPSDEGDAHSSVQASRESIEKMSLTASLVSRDGQTGVVEFNWSDGSPFSRVLEVCGSIPIPPYLNRESERLDWERYQTHYAHIRGSVAAPTAGLHFTERVLDALKDKGVDMQQVCLHVGAGTFLPVKDDEVSRHTMHREPFVVSKALLQKLRDKGDRPCVAVGTTSVRTLESLYYAGVQCLEEGAPHDISQWEPYTREFSYSTQESLEALLAWLDKNHLEALSLGTRIIIVPGFRFRLTDRLVTNFHQPQSTLLLLVSAFTGGNWQEIYQHALDGGYRFLSYGDSSIFY
ncbi:MAG: S-adenosylmethionine:tRNA ribosyltransferase-isomerase [Bacteroidales bacterium]|nr:S-adenosylmethionine:tRNA ribosyltransferase-isomerase [Bacteroidales bacterium]